MDIRILRYFLTVAREGSITRAAEQLHMTQPPLSRQLKDLEDELGKQLFIRGSKRITLTREGQLLRKRAEEMVELMEKTKAEITASDESVIGDIYIGAGQTDAMRIVATVMDSIRKTNPGIHIQLYSGNAEQVTERLDKGLLDFGIVIEPADITKYDSFKLPLTDAWGLLMHQHNPLAVKDGISPDELKSEPLFCSRQMMEGNGLSGWLGYDAGKLNVIGQYDLIFNAALMVEEGLGSALTLDKLCNTGMDSKLRFVPLKPRLEVSLDVIWKKYQVFSSAAALFLNRIQETVACV